MQYRPHERQAAAHKAFLVDGYNRGTLFWGRQVGKSLWSVKHLEMAACYKQGQYFIVFNSHKHAKDVMWRQYLQMIPRNLIADTNTTDLVITFNFIKGKFNFPGLGIREVEHDEDEAPSTIQLLGSDYAYDHTGRKAHGMIFDEYQDQDADSFTETYEPFFATTKGWACFMGTPRGYNHWYDLMQHAKADPRWYYNEATWRDNPAIEESYIEEIRSDAERRGKLDIFLQQYELKFHTPQGSVYGQFDRKTHVISPIDKRIPETATMFGAWDFGYASGHPMAFNIVLVDGMGRWYVVDEIHGTEIDIDVMIEQIRMKVGGRRLTGIVADSARPDLIEYGRKKGLPMIPSPKREGALQSGITLLRGRIRPKIQELGEPTPDIFFTDNCKNTIYQMENYKYKEIKDDRPASEHPIKKDDDHPDALRYLALYLKYGQVEKQAPVRGRRRDNEYGLPV